jgi:hypothetical protein
LRMLPLKGHDYKWHLQHLTPWIHNSHLLNYPSTGDFGTNVNSIIASLI